MANRLKDMGESAAWRLMVMAARRGAEEQGFALSRQPGRGLSNIWRLEKDGVSKITSIRTTRDRAIAFPPLDNGRHWKTLSDVELVLVAAVDNPQDPQNVDVYLFPAEEVRRRFDESYAARMAASHIVRDNYGMWVRIDEGDPTIPSQVGFGLAVDFPRIARFTLDELLTNAPEVVEPEPEELPSAEAEEAETPSPTTIADVLAAARSQIAGLTGMGVDSIKLELKIEA